MGVVMSRERNGAKAPRARPATSADVARASGVSRATVSYVLNNVSNRTISDATRSLVLETASRLGHVPHASARSLRLGHSNVVLALVRDFDIGYIADTVLEGLDIELARRGYVLLVHRYEESLRPLNELWPLVWPSVVVAMGGLSLPAAASVQDSPATLLSTQGVVNHRRIGAMQVEYLHGRGHTHLGYAYPRDESVRLIADERLRGAREACVKLKMPAPVVAEVDRRDVGTIERALAGWEPRSTPITAVCAHNDELAMLLMGVMSAQGLVAGRDLALIGADDIPLARTGLTTVAIDTEAFTARIVARVVAALERREPTRTRRPVLKLIQRSSA
jgi:DNA-binding LacI/PurR family transcriptional regulator